MRLTPGARLRSAVCDTEVIVVRLADDDADLRCGGHPMMRLDEESAEGPALEPAFGEGTAIGKRYTDTPGDLEVLCTKAGAGSLSLGDELLVLKDAKPLPSSD